MQSFDQSAIPYLEGKAFSNGYSVNVANRRGPLYKRLETLEAIVKNKRVIHMGFADHLPLIKSKIEHNNWLHKRLIDSAEKCWGIDIDEEAVSFVRNEIGIDEVIHLDVVNEGVPYILQNVHWDYMIIGEVLEHIDNPVQFISVIREKYQGIVDKIIITVPNAHDIFNIRNIFKGIECINSDHRYWFTPYTLAKVGIRAGLKIDSFSYTQSYLPNNIISRFLVARFPMFREGVMMVFNTRDE